MHNYFSSISFIRFTTKERTFFAKRMAFLVKAGVPIVECISLIRTQTRSKAKARVYEAVIADVSNGQYLSSSLAKYTRLFGEFAVNLIRVGEESGILSQNLAYLADELHKKHELQKKVTAALVYPVFVTVATLGVTGMLTVFIFPKLMPIFSSMHVELPVTTRIMIGVSAYLRDWGVLTVFAIVLLVIVFLFIRRTYDWARMLSDRVLLRLPLIGGVTRSYNLTNFCRTTGLLLRSGISLTQALHITSQTTKNRVYQTASAQLAVQVVRGEPLARGLLARPDLYPDTLAHMVAIGEKTGSLSNTLTYLAELYEAEVDELTKSLSSSIEPVLMIVMGMLVGLIAVSVITPIYSITQHLQPK